MKKVPIRYPAMAAEIIEILVILVTAKNGFLKERLYPMRRVAKSKKTLAAVKPRKWIPPPNVKFMIVEIKPIIVIAPNFLIHQAAMISTEKPMRSHKIGSPNIWKKTGESNVLSTPHNAEHMEIAAISRALKYVSSNTFFSKSNTGI